MELLFGYLAGLLTLINPCVLPVLPIILASAMQAGRHGPLAIAAGMCLSFVGFGMFVATLGHTIGLTEQLMSTIGAVMMMIFGAALLVPQLNQHFANATASISSNADNTLAKFLIMLSFGFGISTVIVALGYGTQEAIKRRQHNLRGLAHRAKPIMGFVFLLVGLMIFFKIHHVIEGWLVSVLPYWFQDLSTNF